MRGSQSSLLTRTNGVIRMRRKVPSRARAVRLGFTLRKLRSSSRICFASTSCMRDNILAPFWWISMRIKSHKSTPRCGACLLREASRLQCATSSRSSVWRRLLLVCICGTMCGMMMWISLFRSSSAPLLTRKSLRSNGRWRENSANTWFKRRTAINCSISICACFSSEPSNCMPSSIEQPRWWSTWRSSRPRHARWASRICQRIMHLILFAATPLLSFASSSPETPRDVG
mmetsp:Transcript_9545/g.15849  ORF Transcript_9545/g.15849 Transcript_9545/m.15849 type:complete len:230 (-) Transcript_9545:345-1034(-)